MSEFVNRDVTRHISSFLHQGDKISMSNCSKSVNDVLQTLLPTSSKYVTTVKPNLISLFSYSENTNTYYTPIESFKNYGGNFCSSLVTHIGANEDKDYCAAWMGHHLKKNFRSKKESICLFTGGLDFKISHTEELLLIERLLSSKDTQMCDFNYFMYTHGIMDAIIENTSIVDLRCIGQVETCRCNVFNSFAERKTSLEKLTIDGGVCPVGAQTISSGCDKLREFSYSSIDDGISSLSTYIICQGISEVGILEVLEIGNVKNGDGGTYAVEYTGWYNGLIEVLKRCPLKSIKISECCFYRENCIKKLVQILPTIKPRDISITSCTFGRRIKSVFNALFSNNNVCRLNISCTPIGNSTVGNLVKMIRNGVLTTLSLCDCEMRSDNIKKVLKATTHEKSNLKFLSIVGNDVTLEVFEGLEKTSIRELYIGELFDFDNSGTEYIDEELLHELLPYLFDICSVKVMGSDEYSDELYSLENMNF